MVLKDILRKIADSGEPVLLKDGRGEWQAGDLLEQLSDARLRTSAYMQPGLYIAEINESGYLGRVLYRFGAKSETPH
ncbi:MAG: hypothetical protein AB1714_02205 [Acidobacteriota bacterium]